MKIQQFKDATVFSTFSKNIEKKMRKLWILQ